MPETNSFLSAAFSLRSCSSSAFKSSFDMAHNQSRKKKRRLAKQTVASLSAQGPELDCSRLAVMNANNDPLGVRSAYPFPVADAEGRPFGFRQFANRLSPFGRIGSVNPNIQGCPEVMVASVQRVPCRGKQATEPTYCRLGLRCPLWHLADVPVAPMNVRFRG